MGDDSASLIQPDWPAPASVRALSTTRIGGFSQAPYDSFNLGDHVGDGSAAVADNRARLQQSLGGGVRCQWLHQVHGVEVVTAADDGRVPEADAAVSRDANIACLVMTADCLPVLFCDRAGSRVAAAHAGWRGLAAGVLETTMAALDCPAEQLLVWLGPAIGPQAFVVGTEVREQFCDSDPAAATAFSAHPLEAGKWLADLYQLARLRLQRAGITAIYGGDFCTYSDQQRFFSYRRDGVTGRMASLIWLQQS